MNVKKFLSTFNPQPWYWTNWQWGRDNIFIRTPINSTGTYSTFVLVTELEGVRPFPFLDQAISGVILFHLFQWTHWSWWSDPVFLFQSITCQAMHWNSCKCPVISIFSKARAEWKIREGISFSLEMVITWEIKRGNKMTSPCWVQECCLPSSH